MGLLSSDNKGIAASWRRSGYADSLEIEEQAFPEAGLRSRLQRKLGKVKNQEGNTPLQKIIHFNESNTCEGELQKEGFNLL